MRAIFRTAPALIAPALIALGMTGLAGPARGFTPERAAIFVEALRGNDCAMTGEEAPTALPPLGLTPDEVQQFVDILFNAELVGLSQDMQLLSLSEELCAADPAQSRALIEAAYAAAPNAVEPWAPTFSGAQGAAMIAAVRGNGCTLNDVQAASVLPGAGIDPDTSRAVVAVLLENEMASVDQAAGELRLSAALCAADPALDAEMIEAARLAFVASRQPEETQPEADAPAPAGPGE